MAAVDDGAPHATRVVAERRTTANAGDRACLDGAAAIAAARRAIVRATANACTQVFDLMARIRERGVAMLVVEQNAAQALDFSSRAVVLELGRVVLEGTAAQLKNDPQVRKAYLAV